MGFIQLSQVWLFGTERMKNEWNHEDAIRECMHTHPDGRLMSEPVMSEAEAEEMLERGEFPDSVWERFAKQEEN